MAACLAFLAAQLGLATRAPPPGRVSAFGRFEDACFEVEPGPPHALIVFYRSIYLANDLEPIEALAQALRAKGFATTSVYVTSLKDEAALAPLRALIEREPFDVVLNATAFFPPGLTREREPSSMLSMRRSCRLCWRAWGLRPGALRRAASDRLTLRCMSPCRRSTGGF